MSNKSIILTETELKTIIKDTVNETLNSYQKNLMNDFRQIFHPASFDNPLTYLMRKPIEEGITIETGLGSDEKIKIRVKYK